VTYYQRKLYAFLQAFQSDPDTENSLCAQLQCLEPQLAELKAWWNSSGKVCLDIAGSSDRVNLHARHPSETTACHPISGQKQTLQSVRPETLTINISAIQNEPDPKKVFWWFWRFYPELWAKTGVNHRFGHSGKTASSSGPCNPCGGRLSDAWLKRTTLKMTTGDRNDDRSPKTYPDALLHPAHSILPDCPLHSYQSTVSAIAGAMFPPGISDEKPETPYLLLFSFSPVQEFIKASRKFLDFWAGSYLLHYLSARLCWHAAQAYGPDAIIVPSLWNQEIFDALMLRDDGFQGFEEIFRAIAPESSENQTPVERFNSRETNSLSTAGFPNMITVLVPGKAAAEALGQELAKKLAEEWRTISEKIRNDIRTKVVAFLTEEQHQARRDELWREFDQTLSSQADRGLYRQEAELLKQQNCWEWRHLWDAQIDNTWEPYWAAVPLGHPGKPLVETDATKYEQWSKEQSAIAWPPTELPTEAEKAVYQKELNVGTWWGSLQQRLRTAHMAVKNTRHWQIPAAPGPRSSLSGQFSAVHPRLNYQTRRLQDGTTHDFREGGGLPESSMRLFWLLMSYAYKGLFNGSEMLNALELTKRMAWQFGGVADSMGIPITEPQPVSLDPADEQLLEIQQTEPEINYDQLIRFPNLSSIAAARFVHDSIQKAQLAQRENQDSQIHFQARIHNYWNALANQVRTTLRPKSVNPQDLSDKERAHHEAQAQHLATARRTFGSRTRGRPLQVAKTDKVVNSNQTAGRDYNGVMFSAKWLADEMNLEKSALPDLWLKLY
jgi:CRISPR-associated protein Cmr2